MATQNANQRVYRKQLAGNFGEFYLYAPGDIYPYCLSCYLVMTADSVFACKACKGWAHGFTSCLFYGLCAECRQHGEL